MINTLPTPTVCYGVALGITLVNAPLTLWHIVEPSATRTLFDRVITPVDFKKISITLTALTTLILLSGLYMQQ